MSQPEILPIEVESQRAVARTWSRFVGGRGRGATALSRGVRGVVQASWRRSIRAQVHPDLAAAPMALEDDALHDALEHTDWLTVASEAVARQWRGFAGEGHILSLFDEGGRMLATEGDPAALEGLAEINFKPGGQWNEATVGTNGPGTALATGSPTHIVGAEHFCERWQRWHCAAVPITDPVTSRTVGVIDISGFREYAHPHTLNLALALGLAIEQALGARALERRNLVLQAFGHLAARYPGDGILALDAGGHVLGASSVPPELADALASVVRNAPGTLAGASPVPVPLPGRRPALWHPVRQGHATIGGCFVLEPTPLWRDTEDIPFQPGDIPVYARRYFEAGARDLGRSGVEVDPLVFSALQAYPWPGSVRELKQVVRRVLLSTSGRIGVHDLPRAIREAWGEAEGANSAIDEEDARLMAVVRESRTMAEAAAKLGVVRSTLYRRIERFGLRTQRVIGRE
jgi:transcriptional regulator of acetoin/glycerol metabolism